MALSTSLTKIDFSSVQTADQSNFGGIVSATGINVSGAITATSFFGNGAGLTGIPRTLTIGTRAGAYTQNALGAGITISLRSGIGTASF